MVDAGSGRGMYVVGSRWHEGTMIAMLRQMESATYGWRYATNGYTLVGFYPPPPPHHHTTLIEWTVGTSL